MTAVEALADRKLIRQIAAQAGLDERTVRNALDGWRPRGSSRREAFEAAQTLGVDVATVPARTDAENAAWLEKQRAPRTKIQAEPTPCPECARLRQRIAELERKMPALCEECSGRGGRYDDEAIDQWYDCHECKGTGFAPSDETLSLRARVAELEAPVRLAR